MLEQCRDVIAESAPGRNELLVAAAVASLVERQRVMVRKSLDDPIPHSGMKAGAMGEQQRGLIWVRLVVLEIHKGEITPGEALLLRPSVYRH